jgi:hypothetical protein
MPSGAGGACFAGWRSCFDVFTTTGLLTSALNIAFAFSFASSSSSSARFIVSSTGKKTNYEN